MIRLDESVVVHTIILTLKDVSQHRHSRFSFVVIYELMHFQCNPLSFEHQWNISWTETNFKLISFMALWIVREGVKSCLYCKFSTWNDIFPPCFLVRRTQNQFLTHQALEYHKTKPPPSQIFGLCSFGMETNILDMDI